MANPGHIRMHEGFEAEWPGSRSLATEIVLNVIRTGMTLHARVDAIVREHGLPSATSLGVLDTLQRRGFVRRQAHPDSRRGRLVEITPSGIEVIERLLPELHRTEVSWMAGLSEREQEQLIGYLGRLQAQLNPEAAGRTWP